MNCSILRLQRVSRVASRRYSSSKPEITQSEAFSKRQQTGTDFVRLNMLQDSYPSYKRMKGQFFLNTTHGPPVITRKNARTPDFIRPLLNDVQTAQQKANEHLINSAAVLGEKIVHPKLGEGYRENYRVLDNDAFIPINFADGPDSVPRRWLRRSDTMQREVNIFSYKSDLEEIPKSINKIKKEGLEVTWLDSKGRGPKSEHVTVYPWDWLHKHKVYRDRNKFEMTRHAFVNGLQGVERSADVIPHIPNPDDHDIVLWDSRIEQIPPTVKYDEVMASDSGVGKWTRMIHKFGFCFVDGVPICPLKTQELLERIAFIRPTHYGGFYDFTSDLTMKDTAYTSEAIGPHTDTTYFTDPAGLQMFHLLSHTEGTGGESILVDGFWSARLIRNRYKDALSKIAVPWHASGNEGINITPNRPYPVMTMDSNRKATQIRWNEADRGTIHPGYSEEWYEAAREFSNRVNDPMGQYQSQLVPGRALIFDNWRILHGRTEFTVNRDDYVSRYLNTNFTREEILAKIL
ncbi:hypothetical protein SBOR_9376 [Sclerotinia borealis F-4128]|uniref:TauD/TfdA-like domain-containing protein n=1 Tax=Sclerotinia borealis (strain F-4128) TaxID=1432307 RepID=W9C5Q9_SCLBF|nr:hypothetical protein SBOR_9376 [Sclerotinia borealis F-4128]